MADEAGPDDVRAAGDPTAPPPPEAPSAPPIAAEAATPAATPAPPAPTTAAPAGPQTVTIQADPLPAAPNPLVTAWNDLDATSRMIIGAAGVLLASLLIGGLFSAWFRSGTFVIAVAAAALVSAGAAAYTSISNAGPKPTKLPLATVEFLGGAVATVLAVMRVIEVVFDLDQLSNYGGLFGVVATIVVAGAAGTILAGAFRRDPTLRTPRAYGDTSVRLAVSGLTLVLIGWALNLSISYWNMNAAASSLAVLTIAAVLVIVASRWTAALPEIPLAWVGAALGVLGLFLALGQWGELMELGTELELGVLDLVAFLLTVIGIVILIVAGALGGRPWLESRPKRAPKPAAEAPAAEPPAATDVPEAPVAAATFASGTSVPDPWATPGTGSWATPEEDAPETPAADPWADMPSEHPTDRPPEA